MWSLMRYITTEKSTKDVAESDKNVAQSKKKMMEYGNCC